MITKELYSSVGYESPLVFMIQTYINQDLRAEFLREYETDFWQDYTGDNWNGFVDMGKISYYHVEDDGADCGEIDLLIVTLQNGQPIKFELDTFEDLP